MVIGSLFALALATRPRDFSPPLVLTGATVIDGTGSAPFQDAVVVIRGRRIAAAGPRATVEVPSNASIVDMTGKWILPGLIDMHVHLDEDLTPSAFPLFGVTSVRDVGSRLVTIQKLRARSARGQTMPRIFWMGRNIDEGKPSWWGAVAVKSPNEVPKLLEDMARQGVDGVKLYTRAGPGTTKAVIDTAHRRGWPVTGHLERTKPSTAASLGIDNLEHVSTLVQKLRRPPPASVKGYLRGFVNVGSVNLDGSAARILLASLKLHNVAVTPTLAVSTMPVWSGSTAEVTYRGWAGVPPGWSTFWRSSYWSFISTEGWKAEDFAAAASAQGKYRALVGRLERAGVPIIAGTDTPAPWVLPGAGLIHEMEMLVDAGLTPMSALQAATGRAACVLRRAADVGTIQPGCYADLLILDADPLKNIKNLRKIDRVYLGGTPLDRVALRRQFQSAHAPPPGAP